MRKVGLGFFVLLLAVQTIGQVSITGRVVTQEGKALAFANVLLLDYTDSLLVKGSMANEHGEYEIDKVITGRYFIRYSAIGFETVNSNILEITVPGTGKSLGTQIMKIAAGELKDIVIRAEKPLYHQEADRMVINVESSLLTKGSSALEVLERSPGVYVDRASGGVVLNGKTGVMVMINGKLMRLPLPQVIALLNGMNGGNIEKIELITNPPAMYDAEGNAGLINIVLKKSNERGSRGTVSLTGGYGWREKGVSALSFTHNTGKATFYGSYSFSYDRTYNEWSAKGHEVAPVLPGPMEFDFWSGTRVIRRNHNATIGFDAGIGKTAIGGSIIFSSSNLSYNTLVGANYTIEPDSVLLMNSDITGKNRWKNIIASLFIEKEIKEGEKLSMGMDYIFFDNNNPNDVRNSFLDKHGNEARTLNDTIFAPLATGFASTPIRTGVFKIDYTRRVSKKLSFETGFKGTHTQSTSISGIQSFVNGDWISSYERYNDIVMKESIAALYTSFKAKLTPSSNLVVGVRYEYLNTDMFDQRKRIDIVSRKQGQLFPDVFFSRKLNDKSELQLSYTRRISRPSFNDLSSFVAYNDFISVFTGNPALRSTITNNIKAGINYKAYSFSLSFSRDDQGIASAQAVTSPSGNILYIAPQNVDFQNNLTFQTNIPFKITKWWTTNQGFTGGWKQFRVSYTKQPVEKTYFGYSLYTTQAFTLPKSFSLEVAGRYFSASYFGSVKVLGFGIVSAGVKKELKDSWGSFQLAIGDVLKSQRIRSSFGSITEEAFTLKSRLSYDPESRTSRIFRITYTKPFGNKEIKGQRKVEIGSADERNRIRKD